MFLILTATLPGRYYYSFPMDNTNATSRWQSWGLKAQIAGLISTIPHCLLLEKQKQDSGKVVAQAVIAEKELKRGNLC